MNKILLSAMLAAAAATPALAGVNNLNYQAVIKDGGNAVKGQKVEMKFEILDNTNTVVYTEEQAPTTNDAGLVTVQLAGEELETLNWGDVSLRVSVNLGSGYQEISTSPVNSVPTAMYALRSADSDEIKAVVEQVTFDLEEVQATVRNMGADVAQIEGLAEEVEKNTEGLAAVEEELGETGYFRTQIRDLQGKVTSNYNDYQEDFQAMATVNEEMSDHVNNLTTEVEGLVADVKENTEDVKALKADVARIDGLAEEVEANAEAIVNIENELDDTGWIKSNIRTLLGDVKTNKEEYQEDFQAMATVNEEMSDHVNNLTEAITNIENELDDTGYIKSNIRTLLGEVKANKEEYQEDFQAMATVNEEMSDHVNNLTEAITNIENELDDTGYIKSNIRTLLGEVKANKEEYQEDFQKMAEFQEGVTGEIDTINAGLANVEELTGETGRIMTAIKNNENNIKTNQDSIDEIESELGETGFFRPAIRTLQGQVKANEAAIAEINENWNGETFQKLSEFQDGVTTELDTFKKEYQEDFQKMVEFQDGVTTELDTFKKDYQADFQQMADTNNEMGAVLDEVKETAEAAGQNAVAAKNDVESLRTEVNSGYDELLKRIEALEAALKNK